jgi:hypothetical protein
MAWKRKQTRYAWGRSAENELRKILHNYIPANCRSSRSGGLFDVWAVGHHIWLFQVKRGRVTEAFANRLLHELHTKVHIAGITDSVAHIFVANRYNSGRKVKWVFYSLA